MAEVMGYQRTTFETTSNIFSIQEEQQQQQHYQQQQQHQQQQQQHYQQQQQQQHQHINNATRKNPKSPSPKVCVPCFFDMFARKKSKKSKDKKMKNKTNHLCSRSHNNSNSSRNYNNNSSSPVSRDFCTADCHKTGQNDANNNNNNNTININNSNNNCNLNNNDNDHTHLQVAEASAGFLHRLSPIRRKESKLQQQQQSQDPQQQPQQPQTTMRRSRLMLNINSNQLRHLNNYPNIEYVNYNDKLNESNITTVTTATGEIVCASTPRNERIPGPEVKTGKVVERLWIQQAPPVTEGKGFDPTAEAKLFEANEGVFIVDPDSGKRYRKGRFLGKGGFANCFEFTDTSTNAVYAGKIVSKSHFHKHKQKEKMMLEIKLHRKLCHENIVAFHDYFEDQDNLYLILELCSRKSLDELLKRRGPLTEPEVRYYMRQVVEGCKYIHSKRIIHRDLKLGNLLLNGSMQIKIADFGLATQVASQDTRKKSICGTPNYVAPEVIRRRFYSYEVDVWSIGCIMYTLLCGVTPFETNNLRATYDRISTATYTLPSYLSPPARDLIVRLLDLDPNHRLSLDQVLYEEFFTTGFAPAHLSPSTCVKRPTFPKTNHLSSINRAQSMNTTTKTRQHLTTRQQQLQQQQEEQIDQTMRKVSTTNEINKPKPTLLTIGQSHHMIADVFQVIARSSPVNLGSITSRKEEQHVKSPPTSREGTPSRARKISSTIDLYKILGRCMGSIQKDTALAQDLPESCVLFVTRWVDFSNKYGFAFQLSDNSTGVLFNDTTRMMMHDDSVTLTYVDWSNAALSWQLPADDKMPDDCKWKLSVLLYVKFYMHKKLKPSKFESSQSSISSGTSHSTNSTIQPSDRPQGQGQTGSTNGSSDSTPDDPGAAKRRSMFASPEESLNSSSDSTIEADSQGFAGSAESEATVSEIDPVFTIESSSSPERFQSALSWNCQTEFSGRSKKTSVKEKENVDVVDDATNIPRPAKRTSFLKQQLQLQQQQQQQQDSSNASTRATKHHKRPKKQRQPSTDQSFAPSSADLNLTPVLSLADDKGSRTLPNPPSASPLLGTQSPVPNGVTFVTKWFREEDGIIMQLSNGTYQVNFSDDHSKLILSLFNDEYIVTHLPILNSCNNNNINNNKIKTPHASTTTTTATTATTTTTTRAATSKRKNSKDDNNRKNNAKTAKETKTNCLKTSHYFLFEVCEKGCEPYLAEKLKVVRRKLYKLINFEGQTV